MTWLWTSSSSFSYDCAAKQTRASPSLSVSHVSLAYLQGNVESLAARDGGGGGWDGQGRTAELAAVCGASPLVRCAIQGGRGRGAGGGGAGGGGRWGGGRAPCSTAGGAGGGADGSRDIRPRDASLLLAGLLLLGLQRLTTHVMVLLPVLVLAEGAAVARRVAAAARLAGFAAAVPAALRYKRSHVSTERSRKHFSKNGEKFCWKQ